jgi:hypothetical protein
MVTDRIIASQITGGALSSSSSTQGPSAASVKRFEEAYSHAVARRDASTSVPESHHSMQAFLDPLLNLNSSSTSLAERSGRAALADMKPSELMMLTMRSHEFLFNCQLVANVANRSSDGVQQLFRQQS